MVRPKLSTLFCVFVLICSHHTQHEIYFSYKQVWIFHWGQAERKRHKYSKYTQGNTCRQTDDIRETHRAGDTNISGACWGIFGSRNPTCLKLSSSPFCVWYIFFTVFYDSEVIYPSERQTDGNTERERKQGRERATLLTLHFDLAE